MQRPAAGTGSHSSRSYPRSPGGGYPAAPDGYQAPAAAVGSTEYPAEPRRGTGRRHAYPESPGETTSPGRTRPAAGPGYPPPAGPPASWDGDRPRRARVRHRRRLPRTRTAASWTARPLPRRLPPPPPQRRGTRPRRPPPPAANGAAPGYPAAAYTDPYGTPGHGYPAAAAQPPADAGTWYPAPTPAPQPPTAQYPYQPGRGRLRRPGGYGNQPGQADQRGSYPGDQAGNGPYQGGYHTDPYGPDGYGGYHSRQG